MLLEVTDLKKYFKVGRKAWLKAVDGVSFSIGQGETLGLVGESGCGKSTLGRTIIGLYPPTGGSIHFDGRDITHLSGRDRVELTKEIQMIYQDPYACLDPRMTVADIVAEGLDIHGMCQGKERRERIFELLELVGLSQEHANRFPHEFSGGQRQRIGIARALAINPRFIICDEPISALDVSIQAQVVNLLEDLQARMGLTYLFIAHDISMVAHISNRIAVMYLGAIAELAPAQTIMQQPLHPYTQALLSAVPFADPEASRNRERIRLTGDVPSPMSAQTGCKFASRCPRCTERCRTEAPAFREAEPGHYVSCHLF
ncbi:MAG: ABC transporter ATP-binding protein [Oscillospiraceae bacterium]|nr:ABC transporter ATP-binding protein [Oscillospiraceae bacterium]